jgi:nitroreductase
MVYITAVFPRKQWRYGYARAYRSVLVEAGHFCQTFCLAATWLGLAPFCTMALADSTVERDLGLDGITESVLYAAGIGVRPAGAAATPLPMDAVLQPARSPTSPSRGRRRRARDST